MIRAMARLACAASLFAAFVLATPAAVAADVNVDAPDEVRGLVEKVLRQWEAPTPPRDAIAVQRAVAQARRLVTDALAVEGWFSPTVALEDAGDVLRVFVDPGPRTRVAAVDIEFAGAISDPPGQWPQGEARRAALREAWSLKPGEPFRQEDWTRAKRDLLNALLAEDFAVAELEETQATIDADASEARLRVRVESGPRFALGEIRIEGLELYDRTLIERYGALRPGDAFRAERLLSLQTALQNTPYFSSVTVEVERDPALAAAAPVTIRVVEALPKRTSVGLGVSSDTGPRGEVVWRHVNFFDRAWQAEAGVRIEQRRQLGFATLQRPPRPDGAIDALNSIGERTDIENLRLQRVLIGVSRTRLRQAQVGTVETRLSFDYQRELTRIPGQDEQQLNALTANWSWTRRALDNVLDPREGTLLNVQVGGGTRRLVSDQDFLRLLVRAQRFWQVTPADSVIVRMLAGWTIAPSREGIPQSFLFRTGGAQTVRGYPFESIGVRDGRAVVGGRYLLAGSAEYVRWFGEERRWGAAVFMDAGDAFDARDAFRPAVGYGVGARWRSPLGPLAVDVAYGHEIRRLQLHLSFAVAF